MNIRALFNNPMALMVMGMAVAASIFGATQARADTPPTVTTVILDAGSLATTSVQVGSLVSVNAMVASSTGSTTPSGTVNFDLFQNTTCANASTTQANVALVNGSATSSTSAVPASGLSYLVYYSGNINYPAGSGVCQSVATTTSSTPPVIGPGTIGGTVFNDLNKNDVMDGSDVGLGGWTVWLHQGTKGYNSPIIATLITDANGNYSIGNLAAGTYFVEEQEQAGWDQTASDMSVFLGTVGASGTVNFANIMKNSGTTGCDGNGNKGNTDGKGSWFHNFMATSTDQGHGGFGNGDGNGCTATSTDQGHGGNGNGGGDNNNGSVATSTDHGHGNGGDNNKGKDGGNGNNGSSWNSNNNTNAGSGHTNNGAGGGRGKGNH